MQLKVKLFRARGPFTSEKTGRKFYVGTGVLPEKSDNADWPDIRVQIMSDRPLVQGEEVTFDLVEWDANKGTARGRV